MKYLPNVELWRHTQSKLWTRAKRWQELTPSHHDCLILRRVERKSGGSGGALAVTICDTVENGERPAIVRAAH